MGKKSIKRVQFVKFLGLLLDEQLSWRYHLSELSKKLARTCGMFLKIRNLLPMVFYSACTMLCLYLSYSMVSLSGVKHMYHGFNLFSGFRRKKSELSHFCLACHPCFLSSKILNFSKFLIFLNTDSQVLFFTQSPRHHLNAFITSLYLIHLFINIPQDRPVKVICSCFNKTAFSMV